MNPYYHTYSHSTICLVHGLIPQQTLTLSLHCKPLGGERQLSTRSPHTRTRGWSPREPSTGRESRRGCRRKASRGQTGSAGLLRCRAPESAVLPAQLRAEASARSRNSRSHPGSGPLPLAASQEQGAPGRAHVLTRTPARGVFAAETPRLCILFCLYTPEVSGLAS